MPESGGMTASDAMIAGAMRAIEQRGCALGVAAERVVDQRMLNPNDYLSFCPRCAQVMRRRFGADWKSHMKPLWRLRYKVLLNVGENLGRVAYETRFLCPECRGNVDEEDYVRAYCSPPSTARRPPFIDLSKVDASSPHFRQTF